MSVVGKGFTCSFSIKHNGCTLKQLAEKINAALGLNLHEDNTGDFEEFSAYSTLVLGLRVSLISHPHWVKADYFEFEISMRLPSRKEPGEYVDMGPFMMKQLKRSPALEDHEIYNA